MTYHPTFNALPFRPAGSSRPVPAIPSHPQNPSTPPRRVTSSHSSIRFTNRWSPSRPVFSRSIGARPPARTQPQARPQTRTRPHPPPLHTVALGAIQKPPPSSKSRQKKEEVKKLTKQIERQFRAIAIAPPTPIRAPSLDMLLAPNGGWTASGRALLERTLDGLQSERLEQAGISASEMEALTSALSQSRISAPRDFQRDLAASSVSTAVLLRAFFESFAAHFAEARRLVTLGRGAESRELETLCGQMREKFLERTEKTDLRSALWEYFVLQGWN